MGKLGVFCGVNNHTREQKAVSISEENNFSVLSKPETVILLIFKSWTFKDSG